MMSVVSSASVTNLTSQECVPEWDQNSTTTLIQMYKERKCLWDTTHEFYKNRRSRREALMEMANHFNCSLADVEKKLYMLRSSFRKEYRRWNYAKLTAGPNNSSLVRKPQWFALDLLMFLKDDVAKKSIIPLSPGDGMEYPQQEQQIDTQSQTQQQPNHTQEQELDINPSEIQNVFYYDSENSTLTPLEPGEVALDYSLQQIQVAEAKQSPEKCLKKRSQQAETGVLELTASVSGNGSNKRQRSKESDESKMHVVKRTTINLPEKDSFVAFGNFVAEELRNIKDTGQMQLAKLRIHQVLFDATRNFLKVPIPRL